jgi:hypothetical protein
LRLERRSTRSMTAAMPHEEVLAQMTGPGGPFDPRQTQA